MAATASVGRLLVFDTKTTCIFLNLDPKSCFATPISDFSFIWSFSLPYMRRVGMYFGRNKKWMGCGTLSASATQDAWVANNILLQRNTTQRCRRMTRNRRSIWRKSRRRDAPSMLRNRQRNMAPSGPERKTITRRCPMTVPRRRISICSSGWRRLFASTRWTSLCSGTRW